MRPTQIADLLANIRASFVSFFSILMFVALGVGVFLGISWSGPALQNAADKAFVDRSLHHFQILFPYGLTDGDIAKLKQVEGVTDVEASWQSFQTIVSEESMNRTAKVQGITERIDMPIVLEGELPTKAGEIALEKVSAQSCGYSIGDTITFKKDAQGNSDSTAQLNALDGQSQSTASPGSAEKDGMKYLYSSTYKVTALVESAEYVAKDSTTFTVSNMPSGNVDVLAWVPAATFDQSAFQNGYPVVNVICSELNGLGTFSDEYRDTSAQIEARVSELGATLGVARYDSLHDNTQEKIDSAQKQLDDAKAQVAEGEKQLAQGRRELESGRAQSEEKLANAYRELQGYEALKQEGESTLETARAEVSEAEGAIAFADAAKADVTSIGNDASAFEAEQDAKLARGEITQEQHDAALDEYGVRLNAELQAYADMVGMVVFPVNHTNFDEAIMLAYVIADGLEDMSVTYGGETMTLAQARSKLAEAEQKLAAGEAEYNRRVAQLNEGWAAYHAAREQLDELIFSGEKKIADGQAQLEEAKGKVAESEPKLEAAKQQFESMKQYKWSVIPRPHNVGAAEISTFSKMIDRLSISMAALFIFVGLLVSYSAVSRIVHEQVMQIGTKKALGLRSSEITIGFLAYSAMAVIAGAVIGTVVGILLVEGIIEHVLSGMFTFGDYPPYFGFSLFALVALLELLLVLGATWLACRGILKEHAIELLKGEKPPEGKVRRYEKWGIWERVSLLTQTIVNNCVNDKRRVFSTVVGVAGCTALIVTAITLNNDVLKSYDVQYEDVYGFDAITYVDTSVDGALDNSMKVLQEQGVTCDPVLRKLFSLTQPNGERGSIRLVVPAGDDTLSGGYRVNPVSGGEFDLSGEGVWVSQAYATHFGAKVGDTIAFEDVDGVVHEVPILGFYEFWLTYFEMVMGRDYYEKEFQTSFAPNAILSNTRKAGVENIDRALRGTPGYDSIVDDRDFQHINFATFSSVSSAVVLIYIVLSAIMAIVVLLNLNVMFIAEKKRELIVLMINGFSVGDAKRYIYNDTIVLTAIGIVLGIVLGCLMGSVTVSSIEPSMATFVKSADLMSILVGILGSAVLALIMSMIALRRIPKFNLTDINKP